MPIQTPFFEAVTGKTISHVWRGYGSALFLEFGELTPQTSHDGRDLDPSGHITLMIEWSWRISTENSILAGSWSDEETWPDIFQDLVGSTLEAIELFGELPEVRLTLSSGHRVVSFMTSDGQPEWALISRQPDLGSLSVEAGTLVVKPLSDR